MKNFFKLNIILLLLCLSTSLAAQIEVRNKIVMTINVNGKNITSDISTVSFGVSRYADYSIPPASNDKDVKDKAIAAVNERGAYSLSIMVRKVDDDMLKLFSKKETRFDGTITITDTYGKNPAREIKFKKAALESYQDQFTATYYDDGYASASVMLNCAGLSINGVAFE